MNLAIIPARGGSKRIPHKNIKPFFGKPIIAYAIQNALESTLFNEVIVSTDSVEIADIAKQYGAKVPFMRPQNLSDDFTPTLPVIAHALQTLHIHDEANICCLYPATPLLQPSYLTQAFEILIANPTIYYVFAALQYTHSPFRSFRLDSLHTQSQPNIPTLLYPEFIQTRSQDLTPLFYDAGQFYFGKAYAFKKQHPIFAPHSHALLIDSLHAQDIDTLQDWQLAKLKYELLTQQ